MPLLVSAAYNIGSGLMEGDVPASVTSIAAAAAAVASAPPLSLLLLLLIVVLSGSKGVMMLPLVFCGLGAASHQPPTEMSAVDVSKLCACVRVGRVVDE